MSRNLKVLITLFSMTALYGVYYWGIPAIIDLPNNIDLIEQAVLKKSGYKISIQNPSLKMGLIPAIKIKADDFAILNDDNSKAFDVEKPYISIRLLPLIFKEIDIHDFSAENIQTNLVFDKDNKLKLERREENASDSIRNYFHAKSWRSLYDAYLRVHHRSGRPRPL